jgi:REP element-mobilizing transposase RayT
MPRQPRLDAPGTLHHVIGRGISGVKILGNKKDREDFLERVADLISNDALRVYAWAMMSTHFHLLARTGKRSLSDSMRKLLTGFAVNFNRRHRRYGHLFQNRYKSILCEDDPYLLELTRYIHLNPLRAGMVKNLKELREYRWCGHSAIMRKVERTWQDTETVLAYFGKREKRAVERYEDFVRKGIASGRRPELVGGGLIRSLGGWSQVLSLRRTGSKVFSDERILGSSEFVQDVISEAEEKAKETLRLSSKLPDLASLAKQICLGEEVDELELRSGLRKRKIVKSRKIFCQIAVKKMGYSGADVARFLGINTSAVNRLAVSDELPDIEEYI